MRAFDQTPTAADTTTAPVLASAEADALVFCDSDGMIHQWTPAAQALLGLSSQAMAESLLIADVLRDHSAQLRALVHHGGPRQVRLVVPATCLGGTPDRTLAMQFNPVLRAEGCAGLCVALRAIPAAAFEPKEPPAPGMAKPHARLTEEAYARLERIIARAPAGIVETDSLGRMRFVNTTWCAMLDYSEDELLAKTVFDITHPESAEATQQAIAALKGGEERVTLEKTYVRRDGSTLAARSDLSAVRDGQGAFAGVSAIVLDISDRIAADRRLRESEKRLQQILDNTVAMTGILRPDGTLIEANAAALAAGGLTRDDVIGRKFWDCYWWSHDVEAMQRLREAVERAARGEVQRYDATVRMKGDSRIAIDFMLAPVVGSDGQVELLVPSGVDISERKRNEEQFAHLMREVNHRSKNLLTVVQSILRQMKPRDVEGFVSDFGKRLSALSVCQDLLINSAAESVALDHLVASQLGHFRDALGDRIQMRGPVLIVAPEVAQSIGMAIYELCTNASKYGALSNDSGRIDIAWTVSPDGVSENETFDLAWVERDGPAVTKPQGAGFGSVVLGDMIAMTLGAQVRTDFHSEGLEWHLSCPLSNMRGG